MARKKWIPLAATFIAGAIVAALTARSGHTPAHAADAPIAVAKPDDLTTLKAEVARLKGMVPDQSHAMADLGYHYSNLWFAGQNENWPLAQFYSDETRSHLKWAVRIIPLRKDGEGREVDLVGILTALEQSSLKDIGDAVQAKDKVKFTAAYKQQLENCTACHRASSKEYIRLQVPERPDASMVVFRADPAAHDSPKP